MLTAYGRIGVLMIRRLLRTIASSEHLIRGKGQFLSGKNGEKQINHRLFTSSNVKLVSQQECIPVGCVPPTAVSDGGWPSVMAFCCGLLLCPSVMAFWFGGLLIEGGLVVESGLLVWPSGMAFWCGAFWCGGLLGWCGLLLRPSG